MYILYNAFGNKCYRMDYEWYMTHGSVHIRLTESVWMVPGTVNPMED